MARGLPEQLEVPTQSLVEHAERAAGGAGDQADMRQPSPGIEEGAAQHGVGGGAGAQHRHRAATGAASAPHDFPRQERHGEDVQREGLVLGGHGGGGGEGEEAEVARLRPPQGTQEEEEGEGEPEEVRDVEVRHLRVIREGHAQGEEGRGQDSRPASPSSRPQR